jgi:hypothetical protein
MRTGVSLDTPYLGSALLEQDHDVPHHRILV